MMGIWFDKFIYYLCMSGYGSLGGYMLTYDGYMREDRILY